MSGELILTRGIPGSGKSTWAREWVTADAANRVRVNRDELRTMLFGSATGLDWKAEEQVSRVEKAIAQEALGAGKSVVVDAMNLRARWVREWQSIGPVEFRDFPISVDDAIERDAGRPHPLGAEVIRGIAQRYLVKGELPAAPKHDAEVLETYTPDWSLPSAWIVDIDGTLAHIDPANPRSPYDGKRVYEDLLDEHVAELVTGLDALHHIVIVTGRKAEYRDVTVAWLKAHGVPFDEIHTRADGDDRKDHTVKREIFDREIRPRFNVRGVIDDRNRVVVMWRSLGLKCFQAQEGNF